MPTPLYITTIPTEYIHCNHITIPTGEGDAYNFIAVDNASEYAFKPFITQELSFKTMLEHLKQVLREIVPNPNFHHTTFILGYGLEHIEALQNNLAGSVKVVFDIDEANRLTIPIITHMMQNMLKRK